MAKTSRELWAKRVERWQTSDLTAKEFAAEIGVNPRTLSQWKWMLGKGGMKKAKRRAAKRETVSFSEVMVNPVLALVGDETIEIVVDGRRVIRVVGSFNEEALSRVLDVLEVRP